VRKVGWNQGEEGWDGTRVRKVGWNQEREGWDGTKVRKDGMEPQGGRVGWESFVCTNSTGTKE